MAIGPRDAQTVATVRILWACGRLSACAIAALLPELSDRAVRRMVCSGRADVPKSGWSPVYAAMPWPKQARQMLEARRQSPSNAYAKRGNASDVQAVIAIRERAAGGESTRGLAQAFGCSQAAVVRIIRRQAHAHVPATARELDLLAERGLSVVQEAESTTQTTGRIIGPDGHAHANVRAAEIASGLDRMALARELARGTHWRYEPGAPPDEGEQGIYDNAPEWRTRAASGIGRHK